MKIKTFTVAELRDALAGTDLWQGDVLPITKHRALSYVRNPRAADDDVVLLVAYDGDRVISYIGIVPDRLFIDGAETKIGWLTSWWVDPAKRDSGVGGIVFLKTFQLYSHPLAITNFSPDAKRVYDATGRFLPMTDLRGRTFIVGFISRELFKGLPLRRAIDPFFRLADWLGNSALRLARLAWTLRHRLAGRVEIEYVDEVDAETDQFIKSLQGNELLRRGAEELNWIIKHPWVVQGPVDKTARSRYYFSSVCRRHQYLAIKVRDKARQLIGFMILRRQDNALAVVCMYFLPGRLADMAKVIGHRIASLRVDKFTTYDEQLAEEFARCGFPRLYARKAKRSFLISKTIGDVRFDDLRFQEAEGDNAFA